MSINSLVFISYSHVDKDYVYNLTQEFDRIGLRYFLDEKDINWGAKIKEKVQDALHSCIAVLVVISPASLKSAWVPFEIGHAMGTNKIVFPLLTHPSLDLPGYLNDLSYFVTPEKAIEYFKSQAWFNW